MTSTRHKQTKRGYSLIEMIITMTIAAIVVGTAVTKFSGFKAKSRLNTATHVTLDLILAAQNYSIGNNVYTQVCLMDNDDGQNARVMVTAHPTESDLTGDGGLIDQDPTDGGTYTLIKQAVLESGVTFCQPLAGTIQLSNGACSKYTMWLGWNYCIIFKPDGNLDNSPGYVPEDLTEVTTLGVEHYQASVCMISKDIDDKAQSAREIEISASGQINLVPRGESGDLVKISGNQQNAPKLTAGKGQCSKSNLNRRGV